MFNVLYSLNLIEKTINALCFMVAKLSTSNAEKPHESFALRISEFVHLMQELQGLPTISYTINEAFQVSNLRKWQPWFSRFAKSEGTWYMHTF